MVYATRGLVKTILDYARRREPESVAIPLAVTPVSRLEAEPRDVPDDTPVFTHFYLPDAGDSIEAVFGVDLGTPPGRTPGIFVSHPDGALEVERTDELRQVVLVAVPPWDETSIAAFDRGGREQPLTIVDTELPEERVP